jgi:cell division protein FtsI/penicillin-binding protein 2
LLGARGTLLASNGQVLAQGSSLSSPIPAVAGEIVGTLGPIPAADREQYLREGYPAKAQVGQDGLEAIFQQQLAGKIGGELVAGKHIIATAAPGLGLTVKTTINPDLEQDAIDAIANHYAGITVLNPHTGAIEAAAGLAWSALQPPGSTFKIITSAAALGARLTTLNTEYPMSSSVKIDGFTMQNAAGEVCGGTLINAFATSCDTTFAPLGDTVGADRLYKAAVQFGFNQPTGIAGALTSTLPAAGATAIGQGLVQATTLEMADVGATIANGGKRPIPTLAAGAKPKYVNATTPAVAGEIEKMMEAVVAYGTGTSAQIPGITVAGKTGTAELASTAGKKNDAKETDAWFVAYAPVPDPKVVVCALFPNAGYGAQTAAPAVKQVLEEALGIN